ncbi:MAG: hypothetical protein U0804_01910 [Gemmataceae bacterium]
MTRRSTTIAVLFAALAGGCFNSHNPSYFPYYFPGGRVLENHGKPSFGYFSDFDPKAARIQVSPTDATAPLGAQVVVVASVLDKDGQPRRSRRVEWMLEGPGSIVEVDESGFYAGRGYKHDNKYAISHTCYTAHTITRGNDDPKDDVEICAGQTFCVVSCPVPGETILTAYAPGVFNWEKGRVAAKIVWGEGRFVFPPPATVRIGTEHALTTTVARFEQDGPNPPTYRVRYRLVDSEESSVVLASRSGGAAREAEATTDADGKATVRLIQTNPQAGSDRRKTRVAVEVLKAADNGQGPGTVVSRRETLIEWAAPELKLDVTAPPVAGPTAAFPATVTLANTSPVDGREARVRVTLSDGATLERSEPPPTRQDGGALVFDLPGSRAGQVQTVAMQVRPARVGTVVVAAQADTADALSARRDATVRIDAGKLSVLVEPPAAATVGDANPFRVAVTNSGPTPARNVTVFASFDEAVKHASGKNPVELPAGTLNPGETRTFDLPLSAKLTGRYSLQATATGDGNLSASSGRVAFDVRRAELRAAVTGPKLVYVNQEFAWNVAVTNAGDVAAKNVTVRAALPPEVRAKDAGDGVVSAGTVEWKAGTLAPGETRTFKLDVDAVRLTGAATLAVATLADGDAASLQAKAEGTIAIVGTPAVVLELATPPGTVEVGRRATFQIRLRNQGTVSARQLDVAAVVPPELRLVKGSGPDRAEGRPGADGRVTFPALDELRPGQAVTYTVEVDAAQPGDARFRAEVKAAHLRNPLREEQPLRVTAGR